MNAMAPTAYDAPPAESGIGELREPNTMKDGSPSQCHVNLRHALRTLNAVRERYEVGRHDHPDARFYRVHVVVERSDLAWLAATIDALEKAIAEYG
jgi:hypothetical protein